VLEAAARECESIRSAGALEGAFEAGARAAASVIRDMKGTVVAHQVEQRAWPAEGPDVHVHQSGADFLDAARAAVEPRTDEEISRSITELDKP
jgi:hypothetical protein